MASQQTLDVRGGGGTSGGGGGTNVSSDVIWDAKGDLAAATGADAAIKVTVGADDTILMADSAAAAGLKWVASASPSAVGTAAATGTSDTFTRGDHVHAHEAAHCAHDTVYDAKGDLVVGTGADAAAKLGVGSNGQRLEADSAQSSGVKWSSTIISVGGVFVGAPPTNANRMIWRAPYACTVTNVRGHAKGGTNAVVNARLNQTSNFLASNLTVSTMDAWADGGSVQNTAVAAGDDIEVMLVSTSGSITEVTVQVDLTRP